MIFFKYLGTYFTIHIKRLLFIHFFRAGVCAFVFYTTINFPLRHFTAKFRHFNETCDDFKNSAILGVFKTIIRIIF